MAAAPNTGPARGLTLIEITVALAIVAVLMSLALPSFGSILARHRLKAAAEHLAHDLGELRFEATQRGRALHLQFGTGPDWCWALTTTPACDCLQPQPCRLKAVRGRDHPGVELVEAHGLRFEPTLGMRERGGGALLQSADGMQLRIELNALGRPTVCAPRSVVPGYPGC